MNSLSLSPRFDLFRFEFPKDFLPAEVEEKYAKLLNRDKTVITRPIDYLNESIQGVTIPGISDLLVEQDQTSTHPGAEQGWRRTERKIDVEPNRKNNTYSTTNPLSNITNEITITFRQNQGLINYFMMYETIFYKICKQFEERKKDDVFTLEILNEQGNPIAKLLFFQPRIDGIDGLSFNYNKIERSVETFDVKFKFNNIDFEFV